MPAGPEFLESLMSPGDLPAFTLADLVHRLRPPWMARAACRSRSDVAFVPNTESATAN